MIKYAFKRRCIFVMTKKWQKFKTYTLEEKMNIVEEYKKGISSSYLEMKYGISSNTIRK